MKIAGYVLMAASAVMLTGCSSLMSLNPFATENDAVVTSALDGGWKNTDGDLFLIHHTDGDYSVAYAGAKSKEVAKFKGVLMNVGGAQLLDLVPTNDDAFQVPVHVIARVWPEGSVLRWTFLDSKWLRDQAAQQLPSQPARDHSTLITAPTELFRAFVLKCAADDRAYEEDPMVLTKVM